jgi:flavorubredoxin
MLKVDNMGKNNKKSNWYEFMVKGMLIHDDKYIYPEFEYINNHTKVKMICPEHGPFGWSRLSRMWFK